MPDSVITGTLTTLDQVLTVGTQDNPLVGIEVSGTWAGTLNIETNLDPDNPLWRAGKVFTEAGVAAPATITANGRWLIQAAIVGQVRARLNPATSGAVVVTLRAGDNETFGVVAAGTALVQGAAATGQPIAGNPLLIGGGDGANLVSPFRAIIANVDTISSGIQALWSAAQTLGYNGASWDRLRTATVFKPLSLGAGTAETTLWTPAAGKKFRLMGALLTCGAASTLTFKDNTAGATILTLRGLTDTPIVFSPAAANGILSAAANNLLTVTRGTSASLDGVVFGTEE